LGGSGEHSGQAAGAAVVLGVGRRRKARGGAT
jgi:hypothetical protein